MIQFFAAILGSMAGMLGQWMTKKAALGTAAVTAFGLLTYGVWIALKAAMMGVLVAAPAFCELSWLIPDNTAACFGAMISATVVKAVYDWHVENIKILSYIT